MSRTARWIGVGAVGLAIAVAARLGEQPSARYVVAQARGNAVVAGEVVDRLGRPIGGAQLYVGPLPDASRRAALVRGHTDGDGRFRLKSLPSGDVQITAFHPDHSAATVDLFLLVGGDNPARIVLNGRGTIEGRVEFLGRPIAGQEVWVEMGSEVREETHTDTEGRYRVRGLPEGEAEVWARVRSGGERRRQFVQVEVAGESPVEADFEFARATSAVEGAVYGSENVPWDRNALVWLSVVLEEGRTESRSTRTDATGRFAFEHVPAGTAWLRLSPDGKPDKLMTFQLGADERVRRDLLLYGGGTIKVDVHGVTRAWYSTAEARLYQGDIGLSGPPPASIDEIRLPCLSITPFDGRRAQFSTLDPGKYTVVVIAYDPNADPIKEGRYATADWRSAVVEVAEDQERTARFTF